MANKLFLDGLDLSNQVDGLDKITEVLTAGEQGQTNNISLELTFTQEGFSLLENHFFLSGNQCASPVTGSIVIECCGAEERPFEISYNSIQAYTPSQCEIQVNLVFHNDAYECLNRQVWWLDYVDQETDSFKKVVYCNEFSFVSGVFLAILFLFAPILVVLEAIENALEFVGLDVNLPSLDDIIPRVTGCDDKFHLSPNVEDMLTWHCNRCGINFESSIFQTAPYNAMVWHQAAVNGGKKLTSSSLFDTANFENLTVIDFLEKIVPLFNAKFVVNPTKLIFEREDFFKKNPPVLLENVDESYAQGRGGEPPTYNFIQNKQNTGIRLSYSRDSIDEKGNESLEFGVYKDIVDYEVDPMCAEGLDEVSFDFGSTVHVQSKWSSEFIDNLRNGSLLGGLAGLNEWRRALLLKSGVQQFSKLIIIDNTQENDLDVAVRVPVGDGGGDFMYNYPMYIDENAQFGDNIYTNFHIVGDPTNENADRFKLEEYVYSPEDFCGEVEKIKEHSLLVGVPTRFGVMIASEIEIDYDLGTITIAEAQG